MTPQERRKHQGLELRRASSPFPRTQFMEDWMGDFLLSRWPVIVVAVALFVIGVPWLILTLLAMVLDVVALVADVVLGVAEWLGQEARLWTHWKG